MIKWVRKIQGEVLKRIRLRVFEKKRDQRELIKVAQRNFRKYQSMREWGWFVIIQKTRPLIGRPDPNEVSISLILILRLITMCFNPRS